MTAPELRHSDDGLAEAVELQTVKYPPHYWVTVSYLCPDQAELAAESFRHPTQNVILRVHTLHQRYQLAQEQPQ